MSIGSLQRVVRSENTNTSGGNINLGNGRFQLRVPGEFTTPEEIYNLVIATHNGEPVYLKEVARVVDGFKEETSISRLNGREAVNISIKKRTGENILSISRAVDDIVAGEQQRWPAGTRITRVLNKAHDIRNMVADLENNILTGLVLVLVVIFFALGIRNAILVSMAIPFSMLLSFIVLYLLDITLNMVVLFSLTLALGMLVDNAIVIIENCYRFLEQGLERKEAVIKGTAEVAWPVIGSTVTTLAAFSPMLFWPGIMGEFMRYLPLTLIITLTSSLFVALVINPAIASLFMKVKGEQHPFTTILTGLCVLILMIECWLLVVGLQKPVEFFPDIDPGGMYVNVDIPEGADISYINTVLSRIEIALSGDKDKGATPFTALSPKKYTTPDGNDTPEKIYNPGRQ